MKVPCKKCKVEMNYPFTFCKNCGWKPDGRLLKKAEEFAREYERKHGIDPVERKKAEMEKKKGKRSFGPGLVSPPPGSGSAGTEYVFDPNVLDCPKCGERIRITTGERPVRISCRICGARIKVLE